MEHNFYVKGKSKGNERQIVLRSVVLLVNKAKEKRIKMKIHMLLSGRKMVGTPEWVTNALTYVEQNHDTVSNSEVEFAGVDIHFNDDNLFDIKGAKAPGCQMKNFVVCEVGSVEDPDVELQFTVYANYSSKLWNWLGQMGGEEFWAQFVQTIEEKSDNLELTGDESEEEEEPEEEVGE